MTYTSLFVFNFNLFYETKITTIRYTDSTTTLTELIFLSITCIIGYFKGLMLSISQSNNTLIYEIQFTYTSFISFIFN